jgi:CheY-like chemotaxis protein
VPIYALTAHALEHERRNSIEAGCDGHIAKPLEKPVLLNIVQMYTGGNHARTTRLD